MTFLTKLLEFWPLLVIVFAITSVGGYGFYKHAVKHTDGSDDIRTADGGQKGLMSAAYAAKLDQLLGLLEAEIDQLKNINSAIISTAQWGALGALVEWTDWVPSLTIGADLSGYSTARYFRIGKLCFFYFYAVAENVTSPGIVQITLPFTAADTTHQVPTGVVNDGTSYVSRPHMTIYQNTNYFGIYKSFDLDTWVGTETGVIIRISGFFEIV